MKCEIVLNEKMSLRSKSRFAPLKLYGQEYTCTNQQINAVICNHNNDPHFVYYSFYANRFRLERAADKTTVPLLNKTNFEAFRIPVPSLQEQRTIAAVLGLVQRAIEHQERLLALTAELKKTLLYQLFTHGLRNEPKKQTELGPIPRSWKVMELQEAAVAFDYGTSVKCESNGSGFPVLRIPNVVSGSIDMTVLKYGQPKRTELESLRLSDGPCYSLGQMVCNRTPDAVLCFEVN